MDGVLTLREAAKADLAVIADLAHRTWPICYRDIISQAQIMYMLGMMYSEEALEQQMQDGHRFLLASIGDAPAGFCSYGRMSETVMRLHKLYVLPEFHGCSIGRALLNETLSLSAAQQAEALELNVNKRNPAYHFYLKHGFAVTDEKIIPFGPFVMDDYIMQKPLRKTHAT